MEIYIASVSKHPEITRSFLDRVCDALEFQLNAHVAPFWQHGMVKVAAVTDPNSIPHVDGACPIVIYDEPDQVGVLGWHTYDPTTGRMPGTAFVNPVLKNGGSLTKGAYSLSATLSHEAIEALINPYVNHFAHVSGSFYEPVEACDRVQGDSYVIGDVSVSNFLGPRAFRDGPGPYDWLRLMAKPWEVRPGGYCIRVDAANGEVHTLWDSQAPVWYKEMKLAKQKVGLSRIGRLECR